MTMTNLYRLCALNHSEAWREVIWEFNGVLTKYLMNTFGNRDCDNAWNYHEDLPAEVWTILKIDVVDLGEEQGMKLLEKTIKRWKESNDFSTNFLR